MQLTLCAYMIVLNRDQGALEDAAIAAQRQLEDCRAALAVSQAECKLAEAAAEAVDKEQQRVLQQLAQEVNRSGLVEQVRWVEASAVVVRNIFARCTTHCLSLLPVANTPSDSHCQRVANVLDRGDTCNSSSQCCSGSVIEAYCCCAGAAKIAQAGGQQQQSSGCQTAGGCGPSCHRTGSNQSTIAGRRKQLC